LSPILFIGCTRFVPMEVAYGLRVSISGFRSRYDDNVADFVILCRQFFIVSHDPAASRFACSDLTVDRIRLTSGMEAFFSRINNTSPGSRTAVPLGTRY
jgi:hypothetical protein